MAAIVDRGFGDAAIDYSQPIPAGAIAAILGLDTSKGDQFRSWGFDMLTVGADDSAASGCRA